MEIDSKYKNIFLFIYQRGYVPIHNTQSNAKVQKYLTEDYFRSITAGRKYYLK